MQALGLGSANEPQTLSHLRFQTIDSFDTRVIGGWGVVVKPSWGRLGEVGLGGTPKNINKK